MKIVLFNGPPRCGKDTAAKAIMQCPDFYEPVFERMSYPNKAAFAGMMKLEMDDYFQVDPWEWNKWVIIRELGVSYRQWQIDFSEKFMKPLYGEDVFGQLFVKRALKRSSHSLFVVPDCGFQVEINTLLDHFNPDDILLVKIYRDGTNFDGDSRSYITGDCETTGIFNNGTEASFQEAIVKLVKDFVNAP